MGIRYPYKALLPFRAALHLWYALYCSLPVLQHFSCMSSTKNNAISRNLRYQDAKATQLYRVSQSTHVVGHLNRSAIEKYCKLPSEISLSFSFHSNLYTTREDEGQRENAGRGLRGKHTEKKLLTRRSLSAEAGLSDFYPLFSTGVPF